MKNTKEELKLLAKDVKKKMIINNFLHFKLERMKYYDILAKDTMTKCLLDKNIPPITLFNKYTEIIKNDFDKLKMEYENIYLKYGSLKDEIIKNDISIEATISQKKNEEFILDNLIIEKNNIINLLKKSINLSKEFHLVREKIRDNLVDTKKGNKESKNITNDFQQNILYESKQCNKFNNQIKKYERQSQKIKNNIKLLEKYIEENTHNSDTNLINTIGLPKGNILKSGKNTKNHNKKQFDFDDNLTKRIFDTFIKVENLFDISSEEGEEEKIIDDELHSDEDTIYEEKTKSKNKLSTNYIDQIALTIPKIDFNLINFNKQRLDKEIDLYSFERRNYNCGNIDKKIKEVNKKIIKLKNKLNLYKQKESTMKDYIKKLKEKYDDIKSLIYTKTTYNIKQYDFLSESLQKSFKNKGINEDNVDFLNEKTLESIILEEEEYNNNIFNFESNNEKSDNDKKETKDTKNYDVEESKKIQKIIINKNKKIRNFKRQLSFGDNKFINELKEFKNLPVSILKKNKVNYKSGRSKSL